MLDFAVSPSKAISVVAYAYGSVSSDGPRCLSSSVFGSSVPRAVATVAYISMLSVSLSLLLERTMK